MSPRYAPVLAASLVLLAVAACAGAAGRPEPASPAVTPVPAATPRLTPVPVTGNPADAPTPTPRLGDVDGGGEGPELTIEFDDQETLDLGLVDPAAKAWRVVVTGTGELAEDRWEIVVESGDVAPSITATEIRGGQLVDVLDLSGFADGTGAAGGCHGSLPVCLDSSGFRLPEDGDGSLAVRLVLPDAGTPLMIRGGTARWVGEPFVLGPWTDTEAFPWGDR